MKIIVIILSVLIAMNVVYCNLEDLQKYKRGYEACARRIGVPPNEVRIDTALCAAIANGEILFSNGVYSPEGAMKTVRKLILDPVKMQRTNEIYIKCDKEVIEAEAVGIGKSIRFLLCGLELISIIINQ
ncbi:uncharacterized protein LOC116853078 isoform X2 [Odontomachus brunneus]|uniref:uncharacterized protein LOC116853078 isoform X2 n=1 Tax=Odontomachus brunneus TaxID=486640 RepID=UPI0013F25A85|nr:uncharacterized protein LOC116853078 isoform X2 [Odontomachus brunneus]